ncbi:MAG: YjjG family noncanonical pyrimidine nucleotidase [Oscillospiraceae bacterium]|nr:YjjG family noncanonical pyrimidine nucleotidase [Oscillospiraceae bacterium]
MVKFLFLDMDETILDFKMAEAVAIRKTLQDAGLEPTDAVCTRYSQINHGYWERLERKEVTHEELMVGRFADLFAEYGVDADPAATAPAYMRNLSLGHDYLPGAEAAMEKLAKKYKIYLASNGVTETQLHRIADSKIDRFATEIFISGIVGVNKPDKGFFDYCFTRIPDFDPELALMVGDSLTSDIQGGINAGIRTCWVNPGHKTAPEHICPDYEIENLTQLEALLERI